MGLCSVIKSLDKSLSVFKKGPDYIDPLWLSKAAKTNCYNLDFYTMTHSEIRNLYKLVTQKSNITLIEGNKGLFDGISLDGSDSNAALAKMLKSEVILVIDCGGMTRGIAPLLAGYKSFDNKIKYVSKSSIDKKIVPSFLIEKSLNSEDLVITREMLHEKLNDISSLFLEGLIIRTLPNSKQKLSQNYMQITPPFFTIEAMQYIRDIGVKHLLVDVPSVDRLFDDGHLSCHNIFWNTKEKKYNSSTKNYTITEMIYVDNKIADGLYLLNLQIPSFVSDAAPSRPIIFKFYDI